MKDKNGIFALFVDGIPAAIGTLPAMCGDSAQTPVSTESRDNGRKDSAAD